MSSSHRTEPPDSWPTGPGSLRLVLSVVALLTISGIGLLWFASAQSSRVKQYESDRAGLELLSIRTDLARAQRDDMTLQMLEPFGLATPQQVTDAGQERVEVVARGRSRLMAPELAPDTDSESYDTFVESFDTLASSDSQLSLLDLFNSADQLETTGRPWRSDPPSTGDAMQELAWLDFAPQGVLQETLIRQHDQVSANLTPEAAEFFRLAALFIGTGSGFFGPDPKDPLAGGAYPLADAIAHEGPTVTAISALLSESGLWAAEKQSSDPDSNIAAPPIDLALMLEEATTATQAIRALTDQRMTERIAQAHDQSETAGSRASLARYGATALIAGALTGLAFALTTQRRRSKELRRRVNLDPLTGAGNRNLLQSTTADLLATPTLNHHLCAMIDMDRFKITNDTYGHAAGDALLQKVTRGLEEIVEQMNCEGATVVRLGGDEFTLTLHHHSPIDPATLGRHLDDLRRQFIDISGLSGGRGDLDKIPIAFSYGIATAEDSPIIGDLLEAADLLAYEEKASRLQSPVLRPLAHGDTRSTIEISND